jgi:N-acetylmuramoyl-L-alanine amidase
MRTRNILKTRFFLRDIGFGRLPKAASLVLFSLFVMVFMPSMDNQEIVRKKTNDLKIIVIDPGHGGIDPGCNGGGEIWEKEVTLAIGLKVGAILKDSLPNVKVLYTRNTDKTLKLWERPNFANKNNADLFISIHCNANDNTKANGSETYFMGLHKTQGNLDVAKRENSAITFENDYKENTRYGGFDPGSAEGHIIFSLVQNAFMKQSFKFSTLVEEETSKKSKIHTKGVNQAGFLVLWKTAMPSVLIETGFLTNGADRSYLKSDEGQDVIAQGIFRAIKQYKKQLEKAK